MTELERAKQIKTTCKSRLTRFETFLTKCKGNQNLDNNAIVEIKLRLKKIEEVWIDFDKAQTYYEMLAPSEENDKERAEFENNYYRHTAQASHLLNTLSSRDQSSTQSSDERSAQESRIARLEVEMVSRRNSDLEALREIISRTPVTDQSVVRPHFPLPKLDLPTFSGSYDEWLGSCDSFEAIIDRDNTIPKIQKLRFLRSYLTGNASKIIDNLETTEFNYDVAWDLLKERFNNPRIIIQNHMSSLFELPVVNKESAVSLRNMLDSTLRHVRALKVLGLATDMWDVPLVYLISNKLDRESRREWERSITGNEMPDFETLTKFLNKKCVMLETLNSQISDQTRGNNKLENRSANVSRVPIAKTFVSQSNAICLVCDGNHYINSCEDFLKCSVNERSQIAKKKGLCYNCLRRNHMISDCRSSNCTICKRRHHTLLHDNTKMSRKPEESKTSNMAAQPKNLHLCDSSRVLLSTAVINITDHKGEEHACRILLDNGSQPNIITENLAKRLNLNRMNLESRVEAVNNTTVNSAEWVVTSIHSRNSSYSRSLTFLILPKITSNIPGYPIDRKSLNIPNHVILSDPKFDQPAEVEALIGAELFYDVLVPNQISLSQSRTVLQDTKFGWIVTGKIASKNVKLNSINRNLQFHLIRDPLSSQLDKFWNIEELSEKRYFSAEEEKCEKHFCKTFQRIPDTPTI